MALQRDNRVKVSTLFREGHKVSEIAHLDGVSRTVVYVIKKRMGDGECVNRPALQAVVERLLRIMTAFGMPFERQQSFDHCLHVCWHLRHCPCPFWTRRRLCKTNKICDLIHFVFRTKKCGHFHSIISLQSSFEIHNNKPFSSISQSRSIEWVKQKLDNNCQTTRIVTKITLSSTRKSVCCLKNNILHNVYEL